MYIVFFEQERGITWVVPPPSNSDHQNYYIFSRGSQSKPSFATVTVRGPHPRYYNYHFAKLFFDVEFVSSLV